jgi:hypothetical protein
VWTGPCGTASASCMTCVTTTPHRTTVVADSPTHDPLCCAVLCFDAGLQWVQACLIFYLDGKVVNTSDTVQAGTVDDRFSLDKSQVFSIFASATSAEMPGVHVRVRRP